MGWRQGKGCGPGGNTTAYTMDFWLSLMGLSGPWPWGSVSLFECCSSVTLTHVWGSCYTVGLSLGTTYPHQGCAPPPQWDLGKEGDHWELKSFPPPRSHGWWLGELEPSRL